MPLLFVAGPRKAPPRKGRAWWWAVWLALGLIVVGHGCHSGDHDIDDEPAVAWPARSDDVTPPGRPGTP